MFSTSPPMTGLRLTIETLGPLEEHAWRLGVELKDGDNPWATVASDKYEGVMLDFGSTWGSNLVASFLFDEGRRSVKREAASLHRAARAHAREHPGAF